MGNQSQFTIKVHISQHPFVKVTGQSDFETLLRNVGLSCVFNLHIICDAISAHRTLHAVTSKIFSAFCVS